MGVAYFYTVSFILSTLKMQAWLQIKQNHTSQWTWVWVNSGSWWWTGRPGVLQSMGSHRVRYDWATELNWTELTHLYVVQLDSEADVQMGQITALEHLLKNVQSPQHQSSLKARLITTVPKHCYSVHYIFFVTEFIKSQLSSDITLLQLTGTIACMDVTTAKEQ